MGQDKYIGFEKVVKDALVAARGDKSTSPTESKIQKLEHKLETAKLSQTEIADIQKQLKQLRSSRA